MKIILTITLTFVLTSCCSIATLKLGVIKCDDTKSAEEKVKNCLLKQVDTIRKTQVPTSIKEAASGYR